MKKNVVDNLKLIGDHVGLCIFSEGDNEILKGNKEYVKRILLSWLTQFESIEMWSDCLSYDWVLFNDLIADYKNGYPELPKNMNYIPFDICTLYEIKGIDPDFDRELFCADLDSNNEKKLNKNSQKHNALYDAKVIKACYEKLINYD